MLTLFALVALLVAPVGGLIHLETQGPVIGVASKSDAWLSTDDGATFKRVLKGSKPIEAITVDAGGMFVVRGDRVAYHDAKAATKWLRLPRVPGATEALVAAAGSLVWIVGIDQSRLPKDAAYESQRAYVSKDRGRTWRRRLSRVPVDKWYVESFGAFDVDFEVHPDGLLLAWATVGSANVRDVGYAFWHVAGGPTPKIAALFQQGDPPPAYTWGTARGWVAGQCDDTKPGATSLSRFSCIIEPSGRMHRSDVADDFITSDLRMSPNERWLWAEGALVDMTAQFKVVAELKGQPLNITDDSLWIRTCAAGECREGQEGQLIAYDPKAAKKRVLGPVPGTAKNLRVTHQGQAWALIQGQLMRLQDRRWVPRPVTK